MREGWIISGAAHLALFVVLLLSGLFAQDRIAEVSVSEVSIISEAEYAALTLPEVAPETQTETPDVTPPEPVEDTAPETPAEDTAPEAPEPEPVETPAAPDAPDLTVPERTPEVAILEDAPEIDMPEVVQDGSSLERDVVAAPSPRVAETPSIAPPPDAEVAPERIEDTAPDPEAPPEEVVPDEQPTAPEEASDRIVTEAEEQRELAPASSMRPRSRPARPVRVAEEPQEETPASQPQTQPAQEPERDDTADAIAAAVAEAQEQPAPAAAPSGPPLTGGEKDAFRIAVGSCWVVDPGAQSAGVVVTVAFSLGQDGRPQGDVRQISASGGDASAQRAAFDAARRAILRCGARGFPLPVEKYEQWRDIEMTFNPNGMQVR